MELETDGVFNSASKLVIVGYAEEAGARILSVSGRLSSRLFRSNVLGVILLVSGWLQSREGVFDSTLARILSVSGGRFASLPVG